MKLQQHVDNHAMSSIKRGERRVLPLETDGGQHTWVASTQMAVGHLLVVRWKIDVDARKVSSDKTNEKNLKSNIF